jgi:hypothetical protein
MWFMIAFHAQRMATKTKGNGAKAAALLAQVLAMDPKRTVA